MSGVTSTLVIKHSLLHELSNVISSNLLVRPHLGQFLFPFGVYLVKHCGMSDSIKPAN